MAVWPSSTDSRGSPRQDQPGVTGKVNFPIQLDGDWLGASTTLTLVPAFGGGATAVALHWQPPLLWLRAVTLYARRPVLLGPVVAAARKLITKRVWIDPLGTESIRGLRPPAPLREPAARPCTYRAAPPTWPR